MFPPPAAAGAVNTSGERASQDIHAAVQKSIALLEETAPKFFPKTGCISCHNVSIPLMALTEARRRGYSVKPSSTALLVKQTVAGFRPERERVLSRRLRADRESANRHLRTDFASWGGVRSRRVDRRHRPLHRHQSVPGRALVPRP